MLNLLYAVIKTVRRVTNGYYLGNFMDECIIHTIKITNYKYCWLKFISIDEKNDNKQKIINIMYIKKVYPPILKTI